MDHTQELVERAASSIRGGAAVLLGGAGFSIGTKVGTAKVPSTDDLIDEIKVLLGIPAEEKASLAEVAEFASETKDGKSKLIAHLIQRLTSTSPSKDQSWLVSQDWRAIFTTNFDDIIEQSSIDGRTIVTPNTVASAIPPQLTPIFYLHGRALDARESDSDPKLVISESNYLKLSQKNKDLYAKLFNEIACARAVILVGYSLRDLEVASGFLGADNATSNKTIIVTGENDSSFAKSRLQKFGTVMPIGLEKFIETLKSIPPEPMGGDLQFLTEEFPTKIENENQAEDFLSLVLRGNLESSHYLRQQTVENEPYCVNRSPLSEIENSKVNRFLVSSDFGNGKSIFLGQAAAQLVQRGFRVFWINTRLPEVFEEIESVLKNGSEVAFIIDDVLRYREVATFIGERLHNQSILIVSTRGEQDSRFEEIASKLGGAYRSLDLNTLDDREVQAWDDLLERWGYWESKAGLAREERINFLKNDCAAETRSIILSLFKESQVAQTIDRIVQFFVTQSRDRNLAFAGLLISSLCQRHVSWHSIISWLDIDENTLRAEIAVSEIAFLFQRGRNWNLFTSPQLADFILRNRFLEEDRDILVDTYSTIVLKTSESANDYRSGWDYNENLKELMKFRFLTRLFGNEESATILIGQVYRRLSEAPRIRNNPQFWLQYAMSRMEVDDLDNAERYINTALSKAEQKGKEYSPYQILDQRARLNLIKNQRKKDFYSENEIRLSIIDLHHLLEDRDSDVVYALRSVPLIEDFLEVHIDSISEDIRQRLSRFLNLAHEKAQPHDKFPRAQKGETRVLKDALRRSRIILFNA